MHFLAQFIRFWYDFIVGDDWIVAAGIFITLALTDLLARTDFVSWWIMPVAVVIVLSLSLWRASREAS